MGPMGRDMLSSDLPGLGLLPWSLVAFCTKVWSVAFGIRTSDR